MFSFKKYIAVAMATTMIASYSTNNRVYAMDKVASAVTIAAGLPAAANTVKKAAQTVAPAVKKAAQTVKTGVIIATVGMSCIMHPNKK